MKKQFIVLLAVVSALLAALFLAACSQPAATGAASASADAAASAEAAARGAVAISPSGFDWLGLVLICFVLPAILSWGFCEIERKLGWIKEGDLKLN